MYLDVLADQVARLSPDEVVDVLRGAASHIELRTDANYAGKWWRQVRVLSRDQKLPPPACRFCGDAMPPDGQPDRACAKRSPMGKCSP